MPTVKGGGKGMAIPSSQKLFYGESQHTLSTPSQKLSKQINKLQKPNQISHQQEQTQEPPHRSCSMLVITK